MPGQKKRVLRNCFLLQFPDVSRALVIEFVFTETVEHKSIPSKNTPSKRDNSSLYGYTVQDQYHVTIFRFEFGQVIWTA